MQQSNVLSRRTFARLVGVGAAAATLPIQLSAKPAAAGEVRLSSNENPYGPSPAAMKAAGDSLTLAWRYPDEAGDMLAESIARMHGVSDDQVILGAGSSEILKATASAFLDRNRKLVAADPTFEAIGFYAASNGVDVVKIPLDANFAHDVPRMIEAAKGAGVVYICNPNNPTATITRKAALRTLIESVPTSTIVMVDEAYHHFATSGEYESVIPLVASHPNLVVSRTFSKIYGMAGLRCGYAIGQKATVAKMREQQQWDSMNIVALSAARASLADADHVAKGRQQNSQTRAWTVTQLDKLGFKSLPSEANFMMIDVRNDVRPMIKSMREHGVHVGRLFPAMPHHLRVTIGTPEQMAQFIDAFTKVTGQA
jgi:histidinol-phosphate aminotransferase